MLKNFKNDFICVLLLRACTYMRVCARFYSFSKKMNREFSNRLKYNEREIHNGICTKLYIKQKNEIHYRIHS